MEPDTIPASKCKNYVVVCAYEFIGTLIYLVAVNFTGYDPFNMAILLLLTYQFGESTSGAHFNPAISLMFYLISNDLQKNAKIFLLMTLSQVVGAFTAMPFIYLIRQWPDAQLNTLYRLQPSEKIDEQQRWLQVMFMETMLTMLLGIAYAIQKYEPSMRTNDGGLKSSIVAFTLFFCLKIGAKTGACLNPAFGFAQPPVYVGVYNGIEPNVDHSVYTRWMWVYMIFPMAGGALAATFMKYHNAIVKAPSHGGGENRRMSEEDEMVRVLEDDMSQRDSVAEPKKEPEPKKSDPAPAQS